MSDRVRQPWPCRHGSPRYAPVWRQNPWTHRYGRLPAGRRGPCSQGSACGVPLPQRPPGRNRYWQAWYGGQFPVEPGRAVMANLAVEAGWRQDADADVGAVPRKIVGLTARGEIGGNAPVIGVDPLGMAGPTQRFQPADVGANEGLGIAADTVDGSSRPLEMLGRAIDASLTCDIQDVAVCGARSGRGGTGHDDHASADLLGEDGIHLDVMHSPIHPVDHQPDRLAHLVAAKPFVEHAAENTLGRALSVQDVARGMTVLRQPFALQRPVHGLDDVAALPKLPQHRLSLWRHNPFAGLDLSRQPHTLQLARALDQEGSILTGRVAHVLVGAQVGELPPLLLGDQHPVEPGEAIGIYFPLKLLCYLQLGLPAQFPGNNLAGPFANTVGDIVAGDVEGFAVVGDAAHDDMCVRVSGVVVIDRDPVELGSEVAFHLLHQITGGLARVGQLSTVLGRDDEAELMPVIAAPVQESAAIFNIALGRIDLALRTILRYAISFEVTQMRVHCPGADKLPSADGSALRVELHHAGLHRHPSRARPHPAPVPAPSAPILEAQRDRK